jgi:hypothetical protein
MVSSHPSIVGVIRNYFKRCGSEKICLNNFWDSRFSQYPYKNSILLGCYTVITMMNISKHDTISQKT